MLGIGDALTLASKVDALLLVTRLNIVRRPMLRELERALTNCQATPLGVVVTGATTSSAYGYAYGYELPPMGGEKPETSARTGRHLT
jgi:hypothetical protein